MACEGAGIDKRAHVLPAGCLNACVAPFGELQLAAVLAGSAARVAGVFLIGRVMRLLEAA